MPTITADQFPDLGHVLVQGSWEDQPGVECVQIVRVLDSTGARTPLRPYVYPCAELGEWMHLSGGRVIYWDNEAPLDTPFHYESEIDPPLPEWPTPGLYLPGSSGNVATTPDNAALDIAGDIDIRVRLSPNSWASGAPQMIIAKYNAGTNNRSYRIEIEPTGELSLTWSPDGITPDFETSGGSIASFRGPGEEITIRATLDVNDGGGNHVVSFFVGDTIDGPWFTLGGAITTAGVESIFNSNAVLEVGSANAGTTDFLAGIIHEAQVRNGIDGTIVAHAIFDQQPSGTTSFTDGPGRVWTVLGLASIVGPPPEPAATESLTLVSNGNYWLRDPLRPCNDRQIVECWDGMPIECVPDSGIFFAGLGEPETYGSNSEMFLPTDASLPILMSRRRRGPATSIRLVPRLFTDRDALLETAAPGSPLLFSAPPEYGIADRYMGIGDVQVALFNEPDHRYQPRMFTLPYETVARPVGLQQGVCGARVQDLCDGAYETWADAEAAELSWESLILGQAGANPPDLGETYAEVNADFADFAAALAGNTYQNLLDGT